MKPGMFSIAAAAGARDATGQVFCSLFFFYYSTNDIFLHIDYMMSTSKKDSLNDAA